MTTSVNLAVTHCQEGRWGVEIRDHAVSGDERLGSGIEVGACRLGWLCVGLPRMADRVGYRATNQTLRGQRVFTNGKNYIVQDIDSHSGGLWKMADTIRGLGSKATRTGTYDYDLNYIGP